MAEFQNTISLALVFATISLVLLALWVRTRAPNGEKTKHLESMRIRDMRASAFSNRPKPASDEIEWESDIVFEEEVTSKQRDKFEATIRPLDRKGKPMSNVIYVKEWIER